MTNPFSKDWKPSEASQKALERDRRATAMSRMHSAQRARNLASDDDAVVNKALGKIEGMGMDFSPKKRAGKGGKA